MSNGLFLKAMRNDPLVRTTIWKETKKTVAKLKWESRTRLHYLDDKDGIIAIAEEYGDPKDYPSLKFREPYGSDFLKVYLHSDRDLLYYSYGSCIKETAMSLSDFREIQAAVEAARKPVQQPKPPKEKDPPKTPLKTPPVVPPEVPPTTRDQGEPAGIADMWPLLALFLVGGILYWLFDVPLSWVYSHKMTIYQVSRWLLLCTPVPLGIGVAVYSTRKFTPKRFLGYRIANVLLTAVCMAVHTLLLYLVLWCCEHDSSNMMGAYLFGGSCVSGLVYAIPTALFLFAKREDRLRSNYWNAQIGIMNFLEGYVQATAFLAQTVGHYALGYDRSFGNSFLMVLSAAVYFGIAMLGKWISSRPYVLVGNTLKKG